MTCWRHNWSSLDVIVLYYNSTQQATSKGGSQEESSQELNHIPDSLDNSQIGF